MVTNIELEYGKDEDGPYIDYTMSALDFSESMIDGERMQGCYVDRDDTFNSYIIAKGNILENITAVW